MDQARHGAAPCAPATVAALAAAWGVSIVDEQHEAVARVLDDMLDGVARFAEVDVEGVAPPIAFAARWDG